MKKIRLTALDGIRGFAALAVFFSHSGFDTRTITESTIVHAAYKTFAVGPNSVQILFVLSGFLMAYLYPIVNKPLEFVKKRYGRIVPIFSVISLYIWLNHKLRPQAWVSELALLLGLSTATFLLWRIFESFDRKKHYLKLLFYAYVALQIFMLTISILILPKILVAKTITITNFQKQLIDLLSTITLTTPFATGVLQLSNVFWSLVPEMYFYLLYPFVVAPVVLIVNKQKSIIKILILLAVSKIFIDLDTALSSVLSFHTMNIARANGFIAGIVAGSIFQNSGRVWEIISKLFSRKLFSFIILGLFLFIQWGDSTIRDGREIWYMNYYYLFSSWIFAALLLAAVTPKSLVQKIFENKFLVFSGMVSYSLYLIHTETIPWTGKIVNIPVVSQAVSLFIGLFVSYLLFRLVEDLYFRHKKSTIASIKKQDKTERHSLKKTLLGAVSVMFVIVLIYSGGYAPSLFAARHFQDNLFVSQRVKLLNSDAKITIKSKYKNLSVVIINMTYIKNAEYTRTHNKKPAVLTFSLKDKVSGKKIFESKREAYQIEGEPHFPFGFPTITDSRNKEYIVELKLNGGGGEDHIYADISGKSVTTLYTNNKEELLKRPDVILFNRLFFALSNPDALFAIATIVFVAFLSAPLKILHKVKIR